MWQVLQGQENIWEFQIGISWSDEWHHGLLNLCHTLHTMQAWQTRVYRETCAFRPEAAGGDPDPEPGILSFWLGY